MKLWDLNAGMQIATSRFQPCGVRALALDQDMLVCSASKVTQSHTASAWEQYSCPPVQSKSPIRCTGGIMCSE